MASKVLDKLRRADDPSSWIVVVRKLDETDMNLRYGSELTQTLISWLLARLQLESEFTEQERTELSNQIKRQAEGSVSVMAQRVCLRWKEDCGEILLPPAIVQRTTERCVLNGLNLTFEPLSIENLCAFAPFIGLMAIVLATDGAKSMGRLLTVMASAVPTNIIVFGSCCCVHSVFLSYVTRLKQVNLLDPFFSMARLLRISNYYMEFVLAVVAFVLSELVIIPGIAPPPEHAAHARLMLKYTLLRAVELTRAAIQRGTLGPATASAKEKLRVLGETLLALLNGNWASNSVLHYCPPGCCASPKETRLKIMKALLDFIMAFLPATPAINRWGPCEANAQFWAMLLAPHNMAARAWQRRWPVTNAGAAPPLADGMASFQQECAQRLRAGSLFWGRPGVGLEVILMNMITYPIGGFMSFASASSGESLSSKDSLDTSKATMLLLMDEDSPHHYDWPIHRLTISYVQSQSHL